VPNDLSTYFGTGTIRPDILPGCNKSNGGSIVHNVMDGNSVVNAACFAAPGLFSLGNESRFDPTLRAQGINNWDFSVSKVTTLTERASLDFRAEFFNLFNRVQFAPPNTSFGGASFGLISEPSQQSAPDPILLEGIVLRHLLARVPQALVGEGDTQSLRRSVGPTVR
jgi:hypothetical protein